MNREAQNPKARVIQNNLTPHLILSRLLILILFFNADHDNNVIHRIFVIRIVLIGTEPR